MTLNAGRVRMSVVSVGARSSLGTNALQVAMLCRARRAEVRATEFWDKRNYRIRMAFDAALPESLHGHDRFLALAEPPLEEALRGARPPSARRDGRPDDGVVVLLLALPEIKRPDLGPGLGESLLRALVARSPIAFDKERSRAIHGGQAGFALALHAAGELLESEDVARVVVGGADSWFDPKALDWLENEGRLLTPFHRRGFLPGEGAAFAVLEHARARKRGPGDPGPLAEVVAVEVAQIDPRVPKEAARREDEPSPSDLPDGLSESDVDDPGTAMRSLVERVVGSRKVGWCFVDVNGERARQVEWESAAPRVLSEAVEMRSAERLGDVGAATGPLQLAIAAACFRVGCAPAKSALLALHSDFGARSAILVEQVSEDAKVEGQEAASRRPSPGQRAASLARDLLERFTVPSGARTDVLGPALNEAWTLLDGLGRSDPREPDHIDRLDAALRAVARVAELLEASQAPTAPRAAEEVRGVERRLVASREATIDHMVLLGRPVSEKREEEALAVARGFRASRGWPSLYVLPRRGVGPFGTAETSAASDGDEDGDAGEDLEVLLVRPVRPADPFAQERRLARSCIEEIGRLNWLRRSGAEEWTPELEHFEERLLESLDALVALGYAGLPDACSSEPGPFGAFDVLAELVDYTSGGLVDDERAFARAFVLSCVEGEDTVRLAVKALRSSHIVNYTAQREGFSLASNPAVGAAMRRLAIEAEPRLVCLAVDVLRVRGEGTFASLVMLLSHPDASVRRAAARGLGEVPERALALSALETALDDEAAAADEDGDEDEDDGPGVDVAASIAESLIRLDAPVGLSFARSRVERAARKRAEDPASPCASAAVYVRLLALGGAGSDLEILLAAAHTPEEVASVGWFGHAGALDWLVAKLEKAGSSVPMRDASSGGLNRVTGAAPGVTETDVSRAPELVHDPKRWRAYCDEERGLFQAPRKHRFGRPFDADASLGELTRDGVLDSVRETAVLELAMLANRPLRLWTGDWIPRQMHRIAELYRHFAELGKGLQAPGEWPAWRLGRRTEAGKP